MLKKKNIAVVGAGIVGVTTAYYLARAGHKVQVFEQERHPAMRTSYANGGQVSVSNSETWNTWANVNKGIRWMMTKDAPLLIRPRLDPAQWAWMLKFLMHTACGDYGRNTSETIRMGIRSRALYNDICREESMDYQAFDRSDCGILHFYKDHDYFMRARAAKEIYNANGCQWDILSAKAVSELESSLSQIPGIIGGTWTQDDWTGDIHKFCIAMTDILKTRYQVEFSFGSQVHSLQTLLASYDAVVVANGVGSRRLASTIGDRLPIYPVKGYSITINDVDSEHLPRVSLLDDQAKIVTSTLGNRFRVAGTAELAGENYDIRRDRIQPLLDWVHENFPKINTHNYTSWACLRPMTPDMMPIVRVSKKDARVFYNTGHGHLGWTLGPVTAEKVSKLI